MMLNASVEAKNGLSPLATSMIQRVERVRMRRPKSHLGQASVFFKFPSATLVGDDSNLITLIHAWWNRKHNYDTEKYGVRSDTLRRLQLKLQHYSLLVVTN